MSERPVPETYGDVTGEYLALRSEAASVAGYSGLLWVRGSDAVSFLDGLLSQDVEAMAPATAARSFLLEPRGKLRALLWVLRGTDEVGLICDAAVTEAVAAQLERFRFRVDAEVVPHGGEVLDVWGPAAAVLSGGPESGWADGVAALQLGGLPRMVLFGAAVERVSAPRQAGSLAATAVRIEAGEPVMGLDVGEDTIPHETGLVAAAVSFTKGCYLGQELVARIDSRGRVNRHLRGIVIRENVLPPPGAAVAAGDTEVGSISSVAESLHMRAPIALGMVRREAEPGTMVTIRWEGGETGAEVRELPLDLFAST